MQAKPIAILFLCLCLIAIMPGSLAQGSEEPCSSRETVYPVVKTAILDEASYAGVRVRYAAAGERLDIIGSKTFGPWCWLEVEDGWVIDNARALSSEPLNIATAATSASGRSCYRAEKAFVTGNMNIRSGASTSSSVVAKARAGDEFAVASSRRGVTWCWLKIGTGWLANTSRVRATEPAQPLATGSAAPVVSQSANINNCCFVNRQCLTEQEWIDGFWAYQRQECPVQASTEHVSQPAAPHAIINSQGRRIPIYGDDEFRLTIARGFYYLRDNLPQWWQYVSIIDDVKFNTKEGNCAYACADWPYKSVMFGPHAYGKDASRIAASLIHETCHIYQWQEGRGDNYDWSIPWEERSHEIECENKEREAGF